MTQEPADLLQFIHACCSGDGEARRRFQEEYGEDIYNSPLCPSLKRSDGFWAKKAFCSFIPLEERQIKLQA